MKTYREWAPDQLQLLPPSPRDWLPADHLVYFLMDILGELDLSEIEAKYQMKDPRGTRPYDPRMMTVVLLYGYCVGTRSSRKLERATYEHVPLRVIAAGNHPDHSRISEFRRVNLSELGTLFVQVLDLCSKAGLVRLGTVALDGTKVHANASKHSAMSYGRMQQTEASLAEEVSKMLQEAEEIDRLEDELYGKDRRGNELREELRDRETRRQWLAEQAKKLRAEAAATRARELKEQAKRARRAADTAPPKQVKRARTRATIRAGKAGAAVVRAKRRAQEAGEPEPNLEPPEDLPFHQVPAETNGDPKPGAQRNFTDPESQIMQQGGAFLQGYNCQAAVDSEHQIIIAEAVTNQAADTQHFVPMLDRIESNAGRSPDRLLADYGYCSEANLKEAETRGVDAYIATERKKHRHRAPPPRGRIPKNLTLRQRMSRKLRTRAGQDAYALRKVIAEPVFGQIKEARGIRRFLLRGLPMVRGEWSLICTTHNLLKLFRATQTAGYAPA